MSLLKNNYFCKVAYIMLFLWRIYLVVYQMFDLWCDKFIQMATSMKKKATISTNNIHGAKGNLNSYLEQREARIRQNNEKLMSLGLPPMQNGASLVRVLKTRKLQIILIASKHDRIACSHILCKYIMHSLCSRVVSLLITHYKLFTMSFHALIVRYSKE